MSTRVVVGLTTIPPRFSTLKTPLDSLMNQDRVPDKIYLYIADYYPRFNIKVADKMIPNLGKYGNKLQIVRGVDYGPISKLFCSLMNEKDNNTILVTCDDDFNYKKKWLSELITNSKRLPDCAVGFRGRLLSKKSLNYAHSRVVTCSGVKKDTEIDIITAVRGWAYHRKLFGNDFITKWKSNKNKNPVIFFNDDVYISGEFQKGKIKKIVIRSKLARSSNMRLHKSSLIKSAGQHTKTNTHIKLYKKYWTPHLETYLRNKT